MTNGTTWIDEEYIFIFVRLHDENFIKKIFVGMIDTLPVMALKNVKYSFIWEFSILYNLLKFEQI